MSDTRLRDAATRFATVIHGLPQDPNYSTTPPRALIVGGFVRDQILSVTSHDIDMEVYGVSPERLVTLLEQTFPGLVNAVGTSFGILKVHLAEDVEFDVSLPRRESKTGAGHRGFTVASDPSLSVTEAARRRDFTINAIAMDPLTTDYFDPFNGRDDLATHMLRVIDPERFGDDPLRVYRAVQLVGRFGLTIEPTTRELLRTMVARGDLEELASERVTEEIKKLLLKSPAPSVGLATMRDLGITSRYFPELDEPQIDAAVNAAASAIREPAYGVPQVEKLETMLGALCRTLTTAKASHFMGKLRMSERVLHAARTIQAIAHESNLVHDAHSSNLVRIIVKRIHPTSWRTLLAALDLDAETRTQIATTIQTHDLDRDPSAPLLHGRDLVALGVTPGPAIGSLLASIEAARDAGTISTRDEALALARQTLGM